MAAITTTGTLTAGNSRTFALAPGSALTLTLLPNCRVTVTETPETVSASDAGGNSPRTHNHQFAGVFTYGPYVMGGSVVVDNASNSGSTVTWGRKDTTVSTSSDGLSLVSGDGNRSPFPTILKMDANLVRTAAGDSSDATDVTMSSFTLPGGFMRNNGQLVLIASIAKAAASQNSNLSFWIGGQTINSPPITSTNTRAGMILIASMAGASGTVEGLNLGLNPFSQATGATISRSIDMTVDQEVLVTLNWSAAVTAGNTCRIMSLMVLGFPGTA